VTITESHPGFTLVQPSVTFSLRVRENAQKLHEMWDFIKSSDF
tara:strand:+ start:266 stop:394 length:129 start_codon:yes stop_codon:yes gene_type:complete